MAAYRGTGTNFCRPAAAPDSDERGPQGVSIGRRMVILEPWPWAAKTPTRVLLKVGLLGLL